MTFVLDTPDQIEAYRLLATLKGLELEIRWGAGLSTTRGLALASARRILTQYNVPGTAWGASRNANPPRTRKQALKGMQWLCKELSLTK